MAEGECKALGLLFRIAALGLSVAATVVMVTASQLVIVDGGRAPEPSSSYSVSYSQYNSLRYAVAAGAVSAVCSAAALFLFAVRATAAVGKLPLVPLLDAAAQGLLFSAAGAAFAARDVVGTASGPWGSSGGGGGGGGSSVCDAAGAFCGRVSVAAAACAFAAIAAAVAALARDAGHSGSGGGRCDC